MCPLGVPSPTRTRRSTSLRARSSDTPIPRSALAATLSLSLKRPRRMCSVPMKLWFSCRDSSCANTTTRRARSVKRSNTPAVWPAALRRRRCPLVVVGPVLRVPRVVGRHEVALAPPLDQGPPLQGLEVVVVGAQVVEVVEKGDVGLGPVDAMVDLQPGHGATALGVHAWWKPLEGRA